MLTTFIQYISTLILTTTKNCVSNEDGEKWNLQNQLCGYCHENYRAKWQMYLPK